MKTLITSLFDSQKRISWRRLAVLALGTALLVMGTLNSTQWLYLGLAYIAGDSAEKAMAALGKK
jgi:O-antigen ligase